MKFIDSNILAYAFYQNEHQESAQKIIKEGGIITSANLIEAFNIVEYETNRDIAVSSIKSLLKSHLKIIDLDINFIFQALKRAEKYKQLKFMDLVFYTTALTFHCEAIVSNDSDFKNLEIPRQTF